MPEPTYLSFGSGSVLAKTVMLTALNPARNAEIKRAINASRVHMISPVVSNTTNITAANAGTNV